MRSLMTALLLFLGAFQLSSQGIEFFHGDWQEALEKAAAEDKIIFVDAYASWCGPCKRMAKYTFTDKKVGEFHNENFINLKLDVEKDPVGKKFRKKYPVSAFPTLYYIDYKNEDVVQMVRGAQNPDALIMLGKQALGKIDRSQDFAVDYEKGNRDPELVYNYIKALNKAGKSSLKISNEYIRSQKDLNSPENLRIVLEACTQADSRLFDIMIKHRSAIAAQEGDMIVKKRIEKACNATVQNAIQYQSEDLLEEAKTKMQKHYKAAAQAFAYKADMTYFLAARDAEKYTEACKIYAKKVVDTPSEWNGIASEMMNAFRSNKKTLAEAEKIARKASEKGDAYEYCLTYASILNRNGKKTEALEALDRAKVLAEKKGKAAVKMVEVYRSRIEI